MSFFRRVPLPLSSLALGLAGLGNLLQPYSPALRSICGALAAVAVALVALRILSDFNGVRDELATPAALAVFPTFFMSLMLLATYLKPVAPLPATAIWVIALVAQLSVSVAFIVRFVIGMKLAQVLPSWFLPLVGFVVGSVTSPAFSMEPVGRALLGMGLVGYAGMLGVIVYRLFKAGPLPEPALATTAIFAAPPSLCLAGYLAVAGTKQPGFVYALLAVAGLSVLFVTTRIPSILRLKFYPSVAALTFPVVISAIALKMSNAYFMASPAGSLIPGSAIIAFDLFAVAMVAYAFVRYAMHLTSGTRPAEQAATEPARA